MKIEKKHIIAGAIGAVTITGALAYLQYKRLMNYCIGFNKVKVNKLSANFADFNIYINFQNNSDLKIEIKSQEYQVYVNNEFMLEASNSVSQIISPKTTSPIGINVKFNPEQAGKKLLNLLLSASSLALRVEVKLKVKLWFFTVNIPYTYKTTLKELMAPPSSGSSSVICK